MIAEQNGHRSCCHSPDGRSSGFGGLTIELRAGLAAGEVDKRVAQAHRAGDVGARALAFYLVDLAERRAHQELGFHSIEQYAETRYHISPPTTRCYLATGRALQELPEIDRAFCEGSLFWSQVRELARMATPETEAEWVQWSRGRTSRQIAAQARIRRKGERPSDPARRRIHDITFQVAARLSVLQWAKWNTAREKLEAELGRPVSDSEMLEGAADLLLSTRPDGSVPGRTPVNDKHYQVVAIHDRETGTVSVDVDGVLLAIAETKAAVIPDVEPPQVDSRETTTNGDDGASGLDSRETRPQSLGDVVGQDSVVANLKRAAARARLRGQPLPHILLCGPPGLGKSSLGRALAAEIDATFRPVSAPLVRGTDDLLRHLTTLRDRDILFLDEIHRLPDHVAEALYEALEDRRVSDLVGVRRVARFTLVGATTDEDMLPAALRSRFAIRQDLAYYGERDLIEILRRGAERAGLEIDPEAARLLARASRDTPRDALALLASVRDEAELRGGTIIDARTASEVLRSLEIDAAGLRRIDREYLAALREAGRPLSLGTLADRLGKSRGGIERVHEPFLIRRGLVVRTINGRELTPAGRAVA